MFGVGLFGLECTAEFAGLLGDVRWSSETPEMQAVDLGNGPYRPFTEVREPMLSEDVPTIPGRNRIRRRRRLSDVAGLGTFSACLSSPVTQND